MVLFTQEQAAMCHNMRAKEKSMGSRCSYFYAFRPAVSAPKSSAAATNADMFPD